jgi:hypothetical protein
MRNHNVWIAFRKQPSRTAFSTVIQHNMPLRTVLYNLELRIPVLLRVYGYSITRSARFLASGNPLYKTLQLYVTLVDVANLNSRTAGRRRGHYEDINTSNHIAVHTALHS